MAFGRRNEEEIVLVETKVWECSAEGCNCWMRDNFKNSEIPTCPICHSDMNTSTKMLAVIHNHSAANLQ